ncbi:hypothetical protein AC249_AIPGENE17671 [Exaiptasia diaphana]|nr:hypothetical protein AC249_AIPGENE17671 [Exaiptasia diaphana]
MVVISLLIVILLAKPHPAWTQCQQLYFDSNQNVRVNAAMDRHYTFIRFNVSSVLDCFTECHKHCRCQSFNFHGSYWSAGTCELNDADAYDDKVSIIAKNGWLFYNLDRQKRE